MKAKASVVQTSVVWSEGQPPQFPKLKKPAEVDVAIVGAGITGLTAAWLLQKQGKRVVLIEAGQVAGGVSGLSTAHLTEVLDTRYHQLISKFGESGARLAATAQRQAIEQIAAIVASEKIGCGLERLPGYLYAEKPTELEELKKELAAMERVEVKASLTATVPLPFKTVAGLQVNGQAQMDPHAYLTQLASRLSKKGCDIFENSRVLSVTDGEPCEVELESGVKLRAQSVVVATHTPINNRFFLHTEVAAYRSYVLAAKVGSGIPHGLFWDLDDPYHYIRSARVDGHEFLIVGGEDHKVGQEENTEERFSALEKYLHERFPSAAVTHRWSAQVFEPVDGLPYAGLNFGERHTYVATGFSGNGMTQGTATAMLIAELIEQDSVPKSEQGGAMNALSQLYSPTRLKPLASAANFVRENVDFPTELIHSLLSSGEQAALSEIKPSEGRVISLNGKKLAVFRDEKGSLNARSAKCTHLGCDVKWNVAEKSWDCPCHGSRFDAKTGEVLDGPAVAPLAPVQLTAENPS